MRVDINDKYVLTSDPFNFVINEKYIIEKGKNKGKEYLRAVAYDHKLNFIFQWLLERMVRDSKAITLSELKMDINKAKEEIITAMGELIEWKLKNYD